MTWGDINDKLYACTYKEGFTLKVALKAIAQLADVDLNEATNVIRRNPLLDEEIHIDEELINLEETIVSSRVASESLRNYPRVRKHLLVEQRVMLKHCFGQITRMTQGKRLPRRYNEQDITFATTRLIRLIVGEALRVGKAIDEDVMEAIKPFLTIRQRIELREWGSFSLGVYLEMARRKLTNIWQTN